jgi:poly[(R)-3-hydroxyalkanoate] polymerase subunit PhaC
MLYATDALRRSLGYLLDRAGSGRHERPSQTVLDTSELRLRRYGEEFGTAGPVLLVPAPIKRGYIFDLLPGVSVLERVLEAGFSIYCIEWRDGAEGDLETTIGSLGSALESIATHERHAPIVIAHSLGGTLAAIAAALYVDRVAKLVLIQAPLRFGEKTGAVRPLAVYSAGIMRAARPPGQIPGSVLDIGSVSAAPDEFTFERWFDAWSSLPDMDALSIHARVIRWTLDEFAPSAALVRTVLDLLYSRDQFARDELRLFGRVASPRALHRLPVAAIVDHTSRLIPPSSTLEPLRAPRVFEYVPEVGVALQHVGPLVGRRAHRVIWPGVIEWMKQEG